MTALNDFQLPGLRQICLVGVRGIGKTTLIRSIIRDLPHVDYIIGSAVLRELAGDDFAHFDHLAPSVKLNYRESAIAWMEERQQREGRNILCDGHTSLLDESTGKVEAVFTSRDRSFFRELILLESPLDVVLVRRVGDSSKKRSLDRDIVAAEISAERETCRQLAEDYGMRLHLLSAADPTVSSRLKEILS